MFWMKILCLAYLFSYVNDYSLFPPLNTIIDSQFYLPSLTLFKVVASCSFFQLNCFGFCALG